MTKFGADILTGLQQMSCKAVAESVGRDPVQGFRPTVGRVGFPGTPIHGGDSAAVRNRKHTVPLDIEITKDRL